MAKGDSSAEFQLLTVNCALIRIPHRWDRVLALLSQPEAGDAAQTGRTTSRRALRAHVRRPPLQAPAPPAGALQFDAGADQF
jgi:hypothetical protein